MLIFSNMFELFHISPKRKSQGQRNVELLKGFIYCKLSFSRGILMCSSYPICYQTKTKKVKYSESLTFEKVLHISCPTQGESFDVQVI